VPGFVYCDHKKRKVLEKTLIDNDHDYTMTTPSAPQRTFAALPDEQKALDQLNELLHGPHRGSATLVVDGRQAEVPPAALRILAQSVQVLSQHESVALLPAARFLTTQQAADLLNVSRPYLIRLLDDGAIPFKKTGTHRRIRLNDVLAYKERRDAQRRTHIRTLSRLGQELDTRAARATAAAKAGKVARSAR
jgi:excisionase family DNA binding protein